MNPFNTRIIIPTRGGENAVLKTIRNIPEEIHDSILLVASEPVLVNVDQIVLGTGIGIAEKRQFIHQMQIDFGEDYFMVDDDVSFGAPDESMKLRRAKLDDFVRFEHLCRENRDQYGLISSHPRFFSNRPVRFYPGLSKFVYHNVELTKNARYDKNDRFEDVDFYLQLIESGIGCVKHNSLVDWNDFSDTEHSIESRVEIIRRWAIDYPNAVTIKEEPSLFAGKKKIPFKIRINWSYANKKTCNSIEFEDT